MTPEGMGRQYRSTAISREVPRLRVRRNNQGEWARRSTSAPLTPPRTTGARPPARAQLPERARSPRVRRESSNRPTEIREPNPARRNMQPTHSTRTNSNGNATSRETYLARMVICTTFARLVSESDARSVIQLAEKLLRRKVTSPLEAFLSLSLCKAQNDQLR